MIPQHIVPFSYRMCVCVLKAHHARLRDSLADKWHLSDDLIQHGGRRVCSTDLAHHVLHAYMAWARSRSVSCGVMFVDLQAAFYSVLRSSLLEQEMHDDLICKAMSLLSITPVDRQEIRVIAGGDYAVAGLHPHKEAILSDMFTRFYWHTFCYERC